MSISLLEDIKKFAINETWIESNGKNNILISALKDEGRIYIIYKTVYEKDYPSYRINTLEEVMENMRKKKLL